MAVTVEVKGLSFAYPGIDGNAAPGAKPLVKDLSMTLREGDRCLLIGANGAGKTTVLKIMGGKHFVHPDVVRVLGKPAFHDTSVTCSGDLSYLGGEWRRDVAFAGFDVPLQMDISAGKMILGVAGADEQRRKKLIQVLDIDLNWRMHKVSDGQRRRVQICMGLLKPFKVLLLDEITVDLDVLARADLLSFLKSECIQRGATIIYATHIFDGLEHWPSHIVNLLILVCVTRSPSSIQAYLAGGRLQFVKPLDQIPELKELTLMRTVEKWLRKEFNEQKQARKLRLEQGLPEYDEQIESRVVGGRQKVQPLNNGWIEGRMTSSLAGEKDPFDLSSNRVLRL